MRRSREVTGLVASVVFLLAVGAAVAKDAVAKDAVAKDATWKDCEVAARNPDRSIVACSEILRRTSGQVRSAHAAAFHHRGLAYAAQGKLDQAIADISAGIRLDPERAYRWQERGEIYARKGNHAQAVADLTEAIRLDPTRRAFRFQARAESYQGLGELNRAIADFDEAIRLDPEARWYRFYARANALRDAGQYDRALADYETALKLTPTKPAWVLVDRGRTYARMGRAEAAKKQFEAALALDPSNEELQRAVEAEHPPANEGAPSQAAPSQSQAPPASPSEQEHQVLSGSAFVVSREGHLLTSNHVVADCTVVDIGGDGTATVVGRDTTNDLALLQARTPSGLELQPLTARSRPIRLGEEVVALGYPLRGILGAGLNATTGTVSALSGMGNDSARLQFTAAVQPGNSGGPLLDRSGAMVGIITSSLDDAAALVIGGFLPQGVNFAIRKEVATAFLEIHGVPLEMMEEPGHMTVADIADRARKSVLPISCRQ